VAKGWSGRFSPCTRTTCLSAVPGTGRWAYDFMEDSCVHGRKLRILTVVDEFTRESHETYVDYSIPAAKVIEVLEFLFFLHGFPEYLRSDNGPEFIAAAIQDWLAKQDIQTAYIEPGKPWQNGVNESFVKGGVKVRRVADQNRGTPALCTPYNTGRQLFPIHFFNVSSGPGSSGFTGPVSSGFEPPGWSRCFDSRSR